MINPQTAVVVSTEESLSEITSMMKLLPFFTRNGLRRMQESTCLMSAPPIHTVSQWKGTKIALKHSKTAHLRGHSWSPEDEISLLL